jgi:hypothetical protein
MKMVVFILTMLAASPGFSIPDPLTFYPFPDAVGTPDSTAIHMNDPVFSGWADGYASVTYGNDVDGKWKTPQLALGHALGGSDDIVCLGRGGQITLTFSVPIVDGSGFDFAVFENGVGDDFLELGWVEVSSDGEHFCRFPNYYGGLVSVSTYGGHKAWNIYGLASKYRHSYGHPFDLNELQEAYDALTPTPPAFFSEDYANALATNFPFLVLTNITHVRIVDVVGDGNAKATNGGTIYDPYPTWGSAGFDLEAIGVINQASVTGEQQVIEFESIPNQKLAFQGVELSARADSGLPVSFSVQSGPASVIGNLLSFTGTGVVEVVASQPGDATYAPAIPVLRSFRVAEDIQHIFVEPVPNQLTSSTVQLKAYASSGLPVLLQVYDAAASVSIGESNHLLNVAGETGPVTLRAFQSGNATFAPAEDQFVRFNVLDPSDANAPKSISQWSTAFNISNDGNLDADDDGVKNLQEFIMGSNPTNSGFMPELKYAVTNDIYKASVIRLSFDVSQEALGRTQVQHSTDLSSWTDFVPRMVSAVYTNKQGADFVEMKVDLAADLTNGFFRLLFQEQ